LFSDYQSIPETRVAARALRYRAAFSQLSENYESNSAGRSVSKAGDVNSDGVDDLIVGAEFADPGGRFEAGESYIIFGSMQGFPAVLPLASLFPSGGGDGSRGFVLTGVESRDTAGFSVSAAGDMNGDGVEDLVLGAFRASPRGRFGAGESYVVFGRSSAQ
jgi:hypothetical protein